jgi:DNA-directed RNA polymerase III subunit RPC11
MSNRIRLCPSCGNLLLVEYSGFDGIMRFYCASCPYIFNISEEYSVIQKLTRKSVDDVLGGPEAWKNAEQTDAKCPKCENSKAFFKQMQTRSADEPM